MTSSARLDDALKAMGMVDAFRPQRANFSGMSGLPGWLWIDAVLHKAFVEVDEAGTEAAAATAVTMRTISVEADRPGEPPVFRADHPFVYFIQENRTQTILFMGRTSDPTKQQ
jgi:serpin B